MSEKDTSSPPEKPSESAVTNWLKKIMGRKPEGEEGLREVIEDYIEEMSSTPDATESTLNQELKLLTNILELRDLTAEDVMVHRADVVAIDISSSPEELLKLILEKQHNRIPVYRDTLDDIIGVINIKDVLDVLAKKQSLVLKNLVREAPVVSPALPVFDLLLMMRETRQQLVFVIDEYGGIDGLITIGDVVGSIIGEVQGEFTRDDVPEIETNKDGTFTADARITIQAFEEQFGQVLTDDERDMAETLGGFIFTIAGRVPARGEVISHGASGFIFEILDADARRVLRLRIRQPSPPKDLS